jgi:phosphoserine phosphatase RsbU/P
MSKTNTGIKEPKQDSQFLEGNTKAIDSGDFLLYQIILNQDWLKTVTSLVIILVPLFFVLDIFMMPVELLPRFAIYRGLSTLLAFIQFIIVRVTKPAKFSFIHVYILSLQVAFTISLMTTDLGGFNYSYYAGLILVIIGINVLMPWRPWHTAIITFSIICLYVTINVIAGLPFTLSNLVNNIFFLGSTSILTVAINYTRFGLIEREFKLMVDLKKARDALWGEMELAKKIQTALLPKKTLLRGFDIAVTMIPALEVGGDYYDIMETSTGGRWLAIGDVAGHGVDSGLIMMMAQSSIMTVIKGDQQVMPLDVLSMANRVIREDITRLGSNHYMTLMVIELEDRSFNIAGHHQDLLVYRAAEKRAEIIQSEGTWIGITDDIGQYLKPRKIDIADDDTVLLFTDGVTEGADSSGEMYGQERLMDSFVKYAGLPVDQILEKILDEVRAFQNEQDDDMTMIIFRKSPAGHNTGEKAGGR